jgi:hypothetical protein
MKVRLISLPKKTKIANLALMKLSAFHKERGDTASIDEPDPDLVYISSPFQSANKHIDYQQMFPAAKIEYGGYGFNDKQLPHEIEHIMPDYSIFNTPYSMGYTTRGCIRSCPFCIVPKMEGNIKKHAHPSEFWNQDHDTIMFLDNNWLALPKWFEETSKWILDQDLTLMEHGMDIRLLNEINVKRLRELRIKPYYKFAFDNIDMHQVVVTKLQLLEKYGFNLKQEVSFYVYLNSDAEFNDALKRCKILKAEGTNAYVMFNITEKRTQRVKLLQRWANRRWHYWACEFEDYVDSFRRYK